MTDPNTAFYMPVFQGDFFADDTVEVFRRCFAALNAQETTAIEALKFQFYLPDARGERCISEKSVLYVAPPEEGRESNDPTRSPAWPEICAAWSADRLAEQSVLAMPLPWRFPEMANRLAGRMLEVFWHPSFTVLAQEYLPTFFENNRIDPIGPNHLLQNRVAMASLILPEARSHHDALMTPARFASNKKAFDAVWADMTFELCDPLELILDINERYTLGDPPELIVIP